MADVVTFPAYTASGNGGRLQRLAVRKHLRLRLDLACMITVIDINSSENMIVGAQSKRHFHFKEVDQHFH